MDTPHGDTPNSPTLQRATEKNKAKQQLQPTSFVRRVIDAHDPTELNRNSFAGRSDADLQNHPFTDRDRHTPTSAPISHTQESNENPVNQETSVPPKKSPGTSVPNSHTNHRPSVWLTSLDVKSLRTVNAPYKADGAVDSHLRNSPSTAFDKLAFKAVSKTFDELQQKGLLLITDDNAQRDASLHLNPSIARFFMTDQQVETSKSFAHQDSETQSKVLHSDTSRQTFQSKVGNRASNHAAHGNNESEHFHAVFSEDFAHSGTTESSPTIYPKYVVKYTRHDVNGPWLKKFLSRPLPAEARELRTIYDSLQLTEDMELYWNNLQKQRYSAHFKWIYSFAPINIRIWSKKQIYKLQWPHRYLRQKALWQAVSQGGEIGERLQFGFPDDADADQYDRDYDGAHGAGYGTSGHEISENPTTSTGDFISIDPAFSEWIKTAAATMSVPISFAWNELKEDGVLQKDAAELAPQEVELMTSLSELEGVFKYYGADGNSIGQEGALEYGRIVLRFTQGLHDYLELKDQKRVQGEMGESTVAGPLSPFDLRLELDETGSVHPAVTELDAQAAGTDDVGFTSGRYTTDTSIESDLENTKRLLENQPIPPSSHDHYSEESSGEGALSDETRSRLLRSARLAFYEKHRSPSLSPLRQVRSSVPQSPFHSESAANTTAKTESDDAAYQHTSYSKQGTAADRPDDDMVSSGELSPNDAGLMSAPKTAQYSIYEGQGLGEQPNQEAPHRHIVV